MDFRNVKFVVDKELCTSCGTCEGVCPQKAVEMEINNKGICIPKIDFNKCVNCGLCVKVCPGFELDYVYFNRIIHGGLPDNVALGHCIDSYSGRTKDEEILRLSQSGGFVSAFLINGIENGFFDGAVVTRWQKDDPFKPITYIASSRGEVLEAVGSKYNPVPVNTIIAELLHRDGVFAYVGTPCQLQGMRKAEGMLPQLKEKIKIYLGLHCLKVFNYHYHNQILHKTKLKKEEVNYFRFRDKAWRGWPCDMRLITNNGKKVNLAGTTSLVWARSYFSDWRCQLCFDKFNELSDISCGDCRIPAQYGEKKLGDVYYKHTGQSDIVIRTERGKTIFDQIINEENFMLLKSSQEELVKSVQVAEKKLGLNDFYYFTKIFRLGFPHYGVKFEIDSTKYSITDFLMKPYSVIASGHYYLCHSLIKYSFIRYILKKIPHQLLGKMERIRERYINHVRHKQEVKLKLTIYK